MGVIENVNNNRDMQATLNRAIATLVQLYTEKPHFIYELLQNAEDAEATKILFIERDDALQVLHDGRPFTERNLAGLTDIGLSDKLPESNKIGKFGIGFKSVFTICRDVFVASEPSHWKGDIKGKYEKFSAWITDFIELNEAEPYDVMEDYTTFFQFQYAVNEKFTGYDTLRELQETIGQKLQDIGSTTLLFLKNIQTIEYRIEVGDVRKSGYYTLTKTKRSQGLTEIVSRGIIDGKETCSNYLKFSRQIKLDNADRSVDIAFKFEVDEKDQSINFVKPDNGCVSVYFPTGTVSGLNFIVQGPFRTTPNRSEVLLNHPENTKLVDQVAFLLRQAITELRDKHLVTAEFLNMLPFDIKVFKHLPLFSPIVESIKKMFLTEAIFPGQEGGYWTKEQIFLSRNNEMTEIFSGNLLTELIDDGSKHVWVSSRIKQFREFDTLFRFMNSEIGVRVMEPIDLRPYFSEQSKFLNRQDAEWLVRLYGLYSDLPACFEEKRAKSNMLTACFVKTADGRFVAPRRRDGDKYVMNIFRPNGSESTNQVGNIVDPEIYKRCKDFFDDTLHLPVPTDSDIFLTDFASRYESNKEVPEATHIEDIKKLLGYLDNPTKSDEVKKLLETSFKLYGVRGDKKVFSNPQMREYVLKMDLDGNDLVAYFAGLEPPACFVDEEFYGRNGISARDLVRLGVGEGIVTGEAKTVGTSGETPITWHTIGKFRYELMLSRLPDVLNAIERNPDDESSRTKSKVILHTLTKYVDTLKGKLALADGKTSEISNSKALSIMLNEKDVQNMFQRDWTGAWLYSSNGILCAPTDITPKELDETLYGEIDRSAKLYDLLGFKKPPEEEVQIEIASISQKAKDVIFEDELRRRKSNPEAMQQLFAFLNENLVQGTLFPEEEPDTKEEFPVLLAGNLERLQHHMLEMLAYADPVKFERLVRSVRTTAIGPRARAHLEGLYKLESGRIYCQLCQKPSPAFEAAEIFPNPTLELESMHLCLCRNCVPKYREFRNNEDAMKRLLEQFEETPLAETCRSAPIEFKLPRRKLWFTPLHFAEVKILMELQKK